MVSSLNKDITESHAKDDRAWKKRWNSTYRPVCGYPCNNNNPSPLPLVLTNNSTPSGGCVDETVMREVSNDSSDVMISRFLALSWVSYSYIDIRGEVVVDETVL